MKVAGLTERNRHLAVLTDLGLERVTHVALSVSQNKTAESELTSVIQSGEIQPFIS